MGSDSYCLLQQAELDHRLWDAVIAQLCFLFSQEVELSKRKEVVTVCGEGSAMQV